MRWQTMCGARTAATRPVITAIGTPPPLPLPLTHQPGNSKTYTHTQTNTPTHGNKHPNKAQAIPVDLPQSSKHAVSRGTCKHSQYMGHCRGCWCTHRVVARLAGVQTEPQQHETMCAKHRSSGLEVETPHSKMHCCTLHTLTRVHTHNSGVAGRGSTPPSPPRRSLPDTSPAAWRPGPTRCCPPAHSLSERLTDAHTTQHSSSSSPGGCWRAGWHTAHIAFTVQDGHARTHTHSLTSSSCSRRTA